MWHESELRSINALSFFSILTSTVRSSLMTLLTKFRCSNTAVASFMRSPYSYFLRYSLLERLFVIYNVSNLDHNLIAVSSFITLYITSSARHSWIMLVPFRSISSQSSFDVTASFADLSCKVFSILHNQCKISMAINPDLADLVVNLMKKQTEAWMGRFRSNLKGTSNMTFIFSHCNDVLCKNIPKHISFTHITKMLVEHNRWLYHQI